MMLIQLPPISWVLTLAWATVLYFDKALHLTASQRWAVSQFLSYAQVGSWPTQPSPKQMAHAQISTQCTGGTPAHPQVDDPLLVIRQWNTSDPAGAWHNRNWGPAGVEGSQCREAPATAQCGQVSP